MKFWQSLSTGFELLIAGWKSAFGDPDAWETSIRHFEASDRLNFPPPGRIVFVGSSSFTFWSTLEQDMAPLPVINRGFGGARLQDVIHYAPRIVFPYQPRAIVLFAGTNDIAWPKPGSAGQIYDWYCAFVRCIRKELAKTPIYYVSITPTPSRWKYWPIAREANRLIQEHTKSEQYLNFIDMTDAILSEDGRPDRSLYRFDRLHPNRKGYVRWTEVIKPILLAEIQG